MTLHKLYAHCVRNDFRAEIDGDNMTAAIFKNADDSLVMTIKLN